MSPAEPFHRALLMAMHWIEKLGFRSDPQAMSWSRMWAERGDWLDAESGHDTIEAVTNTLLRGLPSGWWQDQSFWDAFARRYPVERAQLISMAEDAVAGVVKLFTWKAVSLSPAIQWSQTFEPGRPDAVWPAKYFADIDIWHDPRREERDIRWCWELNRFQHLLWLGAAWRLTDREEFAAVARDHVKSWLTRVCYPVGVQWQSNLEVGLRALSWARCHILCGTSSSWDAPFLEHFVASLYVHARHLYRELGVHLPPGNHLLGEAAALYCLATFYPVFAEAEVWRGRSIAILNRIVPQLILPDGVYAEQATGYLRFALEFVLPVLSLSDARENGLAPIVLERVSRAAQFVQRVSGAFGDMPMVGDSDSGLAIGWRLSDFWDFRPLQASAAVLLDKLALTEGLRELPAESFLMVGERGLDMFPGRTEKTRTDRSEIPEDSLTGFPAGGYWVSQDERFALGFDTGNLGLGPGFCHGHADGLSFVVNFDGKPVVIDPGTGLYNGSQRWRNYFRSTKAHNTITIDGTAPSIPLNTFLWSAPLKVSADHVQSGDGWRALGGTVNWGALDHHRTVLHVLGAAILVFDRVRGIGEHSLEWRLHLDPHWTLRRCGDHGVSAAWDESELEILVLSSHGDGPAFLHGSEEPLGGWYSRYYGSILPTTTMVKKYKGTPPLTELTILKPSDASLSLPEDFLLTSLATDFADLLCSEELRRLNRSIRNQ